MRRSNYRSLFLAFGIAALALAPLAHAQESGKATRRVPGAQLREWLSDEFAVAGIDHRHNCAFLITGPATRRAQYYSCPDGVSGIITGSVRIEGDTKCSTYKGSKEASGCREWHEVGENKFLLHTNGVLTQTIYRVLALAPLAHAQESGKATRRVPVAELREWLSDDSAIVGINHGNHCVYMITGPMTRRVQYYSCQDGTSEILTGFTRIEGDTSCAIYRFKGASWCGEWHEIGENKFLLRRTGATGYSHTMYKLR